MCAMEISNSEKTPFISVVTVNRNHAEGLRRTLASVQRQSGGDFEEIVVDGASTDGSVEVMREFAPLISHGVSEPDSGIYNAMNKGIAAARGKFLLFLNSGDEFAAADVVERLAECAEKNPDADIIYGDTLRRRPDDEPELRAAPSKLTVFAYYKFQVCHQSVAYRRALVERLGGYDESYKIAADSEFSMRCLRAGAKAVKVDVQVSLYEGGGVSATQKEAAALENERIWNKHLGRGVMEDYQTLSFLAAEHRRLQAECLRLREKCQRMRSAEYWVENAKHKPLWFNLALVCKWQWGWFLERRKHANGGGNKTGGKAE